MVSTPHPVKRRMLQHPFRRAPSTFSVDGRLGRLATALPNEAQCRGDVSSCGWPDRSGHNGALTAPNRQAARPQLMPQDSRRNRQAPEPTTRPAGRTFVATTRRGRHTDATPARNHGNPEAKCGHSCGNQNDKVFRCPGTGARVGCGHSHPPESTAPIPIPFPEGNPRRDRGHPHNEFPCIRQVIAEIWTGRGLGCRISRAVAFLILSGPRPLTKAPLAAF